MARKKSTKTVTFSLENQFIEPEAPVEVAQTSEPEPEPDTSDYALTHVVIQLPISAEHVETILSQDDMCNPLEYNPKLCEPTAYTPVNFFSSKNDEVLFVEEEAISSSKCSEEEEENPKHSRECKNAICFWCCHPVEHNRFGMPIRYDSVHNKFTFFGTFCSLECVSAYNFSIHMGSDRAWDVQSWIQIMARNYGIMDPIRPAPSRYTLQIFEGDLTIEEFRKVHKTFSKSVMVNIPPLVSIKPQIETLNTSFFTIDTSKETNTEGSKKALKRKAPANEAKKTLESKLNLSYTSLSSIIEAN